MAQHPSDHRLTTTTQGPGFDNNPLRMSCWLALVKLQAFPCWLFTSQPTPFFGAWRSTSGRSLFGIWPRWRAIKAISGSHSAAILASVTAFMSVRQQLDTPQANSHPPAVVSVGIICSNDPGAGDSTRVNAITVKIDGVNAEASASDLAALLKPLTAPWHWCSNTAPMPGSLS